MFLSFFIKHCWNQRLFMGTEVISYDIFICCYSVSDCAGGKARFTFI